MPSPELIKSLEREGFSLNYPDNLSNEDKIVDILKEKDPRLYLAIPLVLEKGFTYSEIKEKLLKLKNGKDLMTNLDKIILITQEIFKKTKRNYKEIEKIILENKIKEKFSQEELNYYLEEFKESKREVEKKVFENDDLEKIQKIGSFKALETIFSPAKIRIMKKIYDFKELTPTEKAYYYRDIKPLIDSLLNRTLQEYLEVVRSNRGRKWVAFKLDNLPPSNPNTSSKIFSILVLFIKIKIA